MPIDFRSTSIRFDSSRGFIQTEPGAVVFNSNVRRADIAIKSCDTQFDGDDHHLHRYMIRPRNISINQNVVTFEVRFLLRDHSGNIDDHYSGTVEVLVIADVEQPRPVRVPGLAAAAASALEPAGAGAGDSDDE